jgi:hypothetical protein
MLPVVLTALELKRVKQLLTGCWSDFDKPPIPTSDPGILGVKGISQGLALKSSHCAHIRFALSVHRHCVWVAEMEDQYRERSDGKSVNYWAGKFAPPDLKTVHQLLNSSMFLPADEDLQALEVPVSKEEKTQ